MSDRLYNLLPAIYRQRDAAQGQPLRALLAVMEEQLLAIEADVDRLYDNWFIETCDEWVVPYIADLLGIRGLEDEKYIAMSQRSRVANTIRYRRRKGTLATMEQAILDATGWHVRAVEFFKHNRSPQLAKPFSHREALKAIREVVADGKDREDG